jgi:hypothetical protein
VPHAHDDAVTLAEDSGATQVDVLANDTDADGDPLSVGSVQQPGHGTVTCAATVCGYEPAPNFHGSDSFRYAVTDGSLTAFATVSVTVTPVDDPPTAGSIEVRAVSGSPTGLDLLATATDVDGDEVTLLGHADPRHGTLSCGPGAHCTYTSAAGYTGPDSFTYTVSEVPSAARTAAGRLSASATTIEALLTATGEVRIEVVAAPTAGRAGGGLGSLARTGSDVGVVWSAALALLATGLALLMVAAVDRGRRST